MGSESPVVELYDINGNPLAVQNGSAIPASTSAILVAGSDGTNAHYITMDSSGRIVMVGAGVAGTPAGGVVSIQGVASGTTVPVSGTVAVTQSTSPWVDNITQFGGTNISTGTGASGAGIPRVTVSNDSNVLVTQSTSPWVTNVTQFGSNNVVTGTGASGVGIPRVTVSNDSNILATQSGSWTVNQGTPNTLANKWPVQVTDGTHTMPTMDAIARAGFQEITDGTNGPVAVKAASTSPATTDQALVVVISPNQQPIPVDGAPAFANQGISFGRALGGSGTTLTAMRATTYTEQTTNFTGSVKSSSANDTSGGTGARTVTITYYDQTGAGPFTETVTLSGTTAINLTNTNHCFIEKMVVITVGSGGSNAGTISLFTGSAGTGTTVGSIGVNNAASSRGDNTTLWAHHYTPTGKTTSIYLINCGTLGNQSGDVAIYSIPVLTANAAETKAADSIIVGASGDSVSRDFPNAVKIAGFARTTLYIVANAANTVFTGGFDWSDQ